MDKTLEAATASGGPAATGTQVAWPHILCAIPGLGLSGYSVWVHNRIKAGEEDACGISANCDAVIGNPTWGEFAGIPLGYYGLAFFILVAVTAISTSGQPRAQALQRLAVAGVGLIFALGLEYVMWVILKMGCPVCIAVHVVTLVNFVLAVAGWNRLRRAAAD